MKNEHKVANFITEEQGGSWCPFFHSVSAESQRQACPEQAIRRVAVGQDCSYFRPSICGPNHFDGLDDTCVPAEGAVPPHPRRDSSHGFVPPNIKFGNILTSFSSN